MARLVLWWVWHLVRSSSLSPFFPEPLRFFEGAVAIATTDRRHEPSFDAILRGKPQSLSRSNKQLIWKRLLFTISKLGIYIGYLASARPLVIHSDRFNWQEPCKGETKVHMLEIPLFISTKIRGKFPNIFLKDILFYRDNVLHFFFRSGKNQVPFPKRARVYTTDFSSRFLSGSVLSWPVETRPLYIYYYYISIYSNVQHTQAGPSTWLRNSLSLSPSLLFLSILSFSSSS